MKRKFNQFTGIEKAALIEQLKSQPNMQHFLNVLIVRFQLDENKPGGITKAMLANNMVNVVLPMLNPEERHEK